MGTYIKHVPKFEAAKFTGIESIDALLDVVSNRSSRAYRLEGGSRPVIYLKTTERTAKTVEDSDIRMERNQWLVRDESFVFAVMDDDEFRVAFEVAPC